jgi:hypothetical protein
VRNLSYHRILVKGKDVGTARICHRHTWSSYVRNNKNIPVAVCIGLDPALLFAAAISTKEPMDETAIAGGFYQTPVKMVRMENGICVPTSAEIVLLGRLTPEGGALLTYRVVRSSMSYSKNFLRFDKLSQNIAHLGDFPVFLRDTEISLVRQSVVEML